jgi:3-dehydroquinate dehydratase
MSGTFHDPIAVLTLSGKPQELPLTPAARRRVRLVEVRLDLVDSREWGTRAREAERAFPSARLIGTLRLEKDGGRWADGMSRGEAIASALALRRWDYWDLEDDSPERDGLHALLTQRSPWTRLVLSRHSFTPLDPPAMLEQVAAVRDNAVGLGAEIAKWAGRSLDPDEAGPELLRLLSLWDAPATPAVFLMGTGSEAWRVAASRMSGGWGYAHDGSGAVAPGQLPWTVFDALIGSLPPCRAWDESWFRGVESAVALAMREERDA